MSALGDHRRRLAERGLKRVELRARPEDARRLKALARILAKDDAAAESLRASLDKALPEERPKTFKELLLSPPVDDEFAEIMEQIVADRKSYKLRDVDW